MLLVSCLPEGGAFDEGQAVLHDFRSSEVAGRGIEGYRFGIRFTVEGCRILNCLLEVYLNLSRKPQAPSTLSPGHEALKRVQWFV